MKQIAESTCVGIYLVNKRERNGRLTPTLRVGWVDPGGTPRRTTISVPHHGLMEALRIALEKRQGEVSSADVKRAFAVFHTRLNQLEN